MIWRPYILKSISVDEVQDCKCASCSQHGSGVKKTGTRSGIHLKRFRKVENSVEKFHRQVKFPMDKTVIGGKKYGSPMSAHYTAAVKFKERWWNCNDTVVKIMEKGKVVLEAAYILFYKQMWGYLKTTMSGRAFG